MKLLTWNTQWCCGNDGAVDPRRIVQVARQLADFDVLCLQEIAVNYPGLRGNAGHNQPEVLRSLLPGFQLFFGPAVDEWNGGEHRQFGNLVATRLPVAQVQHHLLPYPADPGVRSMPRACTVLTVLDARLGPVRVMTTHLEFYSRAQRMAQANALRELHAQACAHADGPPKPSSDGSPFQTKVHTANAVLCGDFNFEAQGPEYAAITQPFVHGRLHDSWRLLHGNLPHTPTFHVHDQTYSPTPVACDFVFISDSLRQKVRSLDIDSRTQASDHQPVTVDIH
jgi:endonuclease/exonuclease/phosphatase family metal-dependent hydrolase